LSTSAKVDISVIVVVFLKDGKSSCPLPPPVVLVLVVREDNLDFGVTEAAADNLDLGVGEAAAEEFNF
jgi:hypothetical protein